MKGEHRQVVLLSILAIVATALVLFYGVFQIPFHFDDYVNIVRNRSVLSFHEFWKQFGNFSGLFQRPLVFALWTWEISVLGFQTAGLHLLNVLIHMLNASLVFILFRRYSPWALGIALLFCAHPITTSVVSQISGRFYSLGLLWALIGLLLWDRQKKITWIQFVLFSLMVLTKQYFLIYPLILVFWSLHESGRLSQEFLIKWVVGFFCFAIPVWIYFGQRNFGFLKIGPGKFLMSQLGNWTEILQYYVWPTNVTLVTDLRPYLEFDWFMLVPVCGIFAMVYWSWKNKSELWARTFLIGWVLLIPTNTVFPRNEVILIWRLYPGLLFFIAGWVILLEKQIQHRVTRRWIQGAFFLILLGFGSLVHRLNRIYQSPVTAYEHASIVHPRSYITWYNLGVAYLSVRQIESAVHAFEKARLTSPFRREARQKLVEIYNAKGEKQKLEPLYKELEFIQKLRK